MAPDRRADGGQILTSPTEDYKKLSAGPACISHSVSHIPKFIQLWSGVVHAIEV